MIRRLNGQENGRYAVYSMNQVFDSGWGFILPSKAFTLYSYLKTFLNNKSNICNPNQETILTNIQINKDNLAASIEFLNLFRFINVKNGDYRYNISNQYQVLDIPTVNTTILNTDFLKVSKYILMQREERKNETDKIRYRKGMSFLSKAIEDIDEKNLKLTYETKAEKGYRIRVDGTRKSPKERMESNQKVEKFAQKLAQGIYNILLATTRDKENYNRVVEYFLENGIPKGDLETPVEIQNFHREQEISTEGYNIQCNTQFNVQYNTDDKTYKFEGISVTDIEDMFISEDKASNTSKVEKLLKDIEGQLVKFNVSQEQQDAIMSLLENKNLQHLNDVFESFKLLIEVNFEADDNDNDNYAWSVCNKPSTATAKAAARGFKNRSLRKQAEQRAKEVNKDRAPLKPTPRDYYDQFFD